MARCEDYPCCGHTDGLPCDWTPDPVSTWAHAGCDHEAGDCYLDDLGEDEDGLSDVDADAMTLASAGMGTDEDYGYFGGNE